MQNRDFYTTPSWQKTSLGTPIALSASGPLARLVSQRPILLIGGVHGDEPEGVHLAQATLDWLQQQSSALPWVVIPCLNVDGYKARTRVNARGVDLNRNYPSRDWSPRSEKPRYYPGPHPASEPEIQGMVTLIQSIKPRLLIHCHSWEPCIVYTGDPALKDAEHLSQASGYKLTPTIGYETPGSLSAYGWHDHQIPVICIEEQEQLADFTSIWPRFAPAMKEIFTHHDARF